MTHITADGGLPVCNFCEQRYDPYDQHTCEGNSIGPRGRKPVEDEFSPPAEPQGDMISDLYTRRAYPELGLTRQEIGEALDAERASALSVQPGGDHYRTMSIQPVEFIVANNVPFLAANIIKYASRYKAKGGAEDIRKIKHYCDLILEFEYGEK